MDPIISIIIPVYNIKLYLDKCLTSTISQTYKSLEIILIDDGSTDGSGDICNQWEKKDSRIKCIHQKNKGISASRNVGFAQSKGNYILFLDGDDEIACDMCEKMLHKIIQEHADLCYCGYYFISYEGNKEYLPNNHKIFNTEEMLSALLDDKSFYCVVWNKLFKREMLYDAKKFFIPFPEDIYVGEDQLWLTRVLKNANKVISVPEALYFWNRRVDSATNGSMGASLTKRYLTVLDADVATIREMPSIMTKNTALKKYVYNICEIMIKAYHEHDKVVQEEMLQRYRRSRKMYTKVNLFSIKTDFVTWLVKMDAPCSFITMVWHFSRFWRH